MPACQSIIKKAVVKRLMTKHHTSVLPETGAEYKIRFMLRKNVCEIMLDTTGDGLHKRGYRRNAMEAPSARRWRRPSPTWAVSAATALWKTLSAAAAPCSSKQPRRP